MDVTSFHFHEVERRNLVQDAVNDPAHPGERQKETAGCDEKSSTRPVTNALIHNFADTRALEKQEHEHSPRNDQQQDKPFVGHEELNHDRPALGRGHPGLGARFDVLSNPRQSCMEVEFSFAKPTTNEIVRCAWCYL